jgi:hypothetical protein
LQIQLKEGIGGEREGDFTDNFNETNKLELGPKKNTNPFLA